MRRGFEDFMLHVWFNELYCCITEPRVLLYGDQKCSYIEGNVIGRIVQKVSRPWSFVSFSHSSFSPIVSCKRRDCIQMTEGYLLWMGVFVFLFLAKNFLFFYLSLFHIYGSSSLFLCLCVLMPFLPAFLSLSVFAPSLSPPSLPPSSPLSFLWHWDWTFTLNWSQAFFFFVFVIETGSHLSC